MNTDGFITIDCTVCRPKFGSVWIVIDGAEGTRSEVLSLSAIHTDDAEAIEAADRVRTMQLRVRSDQDEALGLSVIPKPKPPKVPAYGDLFGALA